MRKIAAFVMAAVFSIFILQPKTANAVTFTSFDFTGTCNFDCTGTVTATLVLQNYTIGQPLNGGNFFSFTYHSNIFPNLTVNLADIGGMSGQFNSLPGAAFVDMTFTALMTVFEFRSDTLGNWFIGPLVAQNCGEDCGMNGQWSVPLPATLPLFATGLGALGLLGWRRKRKAAPLDA
jgi:hypothetical protein